MSDVQITISAETQQALKNIQSFSSSAISSFKAFGAAAVAYLGSRAIVGSIEAFIDAASESEAAINNLNVSLASAGTYSEKASQGLQDFAAQMQATTGISDELVLNQIAIARNFTKTNEEAQKLTQAAIQLSAATGKDLDSSIQALGKSVQGVGGSLEKSVPAVKGFTEAQLKAGAAVEFVLQRFGGVAEAKLQSFGGAILGTKNAFGDLLEIIGDVIIKNPILIGLIDLLRKAFLSLGEYIKDNQKLMSDLLTKGLKVLVSIIPVAVSLLRKFNEGFGLIKIGIQQVIILVTQFLKAISEFKIIKVAINSVIDVFLILGETIAKTLSGILSLVSKIPGAASAFDALGINIDDTRSTIDSFISDIQSIQGLDATESLTQSFEEMNQVANESLTNVVSSVEQSNINMAEFEQTTIMATDSIMKLGDTQVDASKKALEALNKNAQATRNLRQELEDVKKKAEDAFKNPYNFFVNMIVESQEKINGKFKKVLDNVRTWVADNPVVVETVAAGAGLLNSLFKSGAGSSKALEEELVKQIEGAKSQLNAAITEINNQRDEAILNIEGDFQTSLAEVQSQLADGSLTQVEYQQKINDLEKKRFKDIATENKKAQEKAQAERVANEKEIAKIREDNAKKLADLQEKNVQAAAGITGQIANAVGTAMGLPPIFADIINLLAAPPEVWESIITGLVEGIPIFIERFLENIPTIVLALAEKAPDIAIAIADSLVEKLSDPEFWIKVANAAIKVAELPVTLFNRAMDRLKNAITDFGSTVFKSASDFFKKILQGAGEFVQKIIDGIKNVDLAKSVGVKSDGGGKVDVIGAAANAIGVKVPKIKLASGGTVPSGFPNDTFGANLTSGEMVIPTDDVSRLSRFLDRQETAPNNDNLLSQLKTILSSTNQEKKLTINLQVGEKQLASVLLDLNRKGFRTV